MELGDYRQAELHLKRAYDLRRRQLGENDLLVLDSMSQLGRLRLLQGQYAEAEPLLARALDSATRIDERILGRVPSTKETIEG